MTKKETMQQMLQDVIDQFVVDPGSRSTANLIGCSYNPKNPELSPGCAIGMYLKPNLCKKLDEEGSIDDIYDSKRKYLLPVWMQNLGEQFLLAIQNFHDNRLNFTLKGISIDGLKEIKRIVNNYDLVMPSIKKENMP